MISITGYRRSGGVKYNAVLDVQIGAQTDIELLGLVEVKRHLNLLFDTSGSFDFTDDDAKIEQIIVECRRAIETYTGCSIGTKEMQCVIRNEKGNQEIPYGPIQSVDSTVTEDGEAIPDVKIRGLLFKWVESPCNCYMHLTYTAGYTGLTLPEDLRRAIKEEVAYRYKNQGDQGREVNHDIGVQSESARNLADPYRRTQWLL